MQHDLIAVIDFGGQYAHLIATKIRREGVLARIHQPEDPTEAYRGYRGIVISGSPALASHGEGSIYNHEIYDLDLPILGLCFGHQEIAKHYGGKVTHGGREWGPATFVTMRDHPLFDGLGRREPVFMSHFDSVADPGPKLEELGKSIPAGGTTPHPNAAIGSDSLRRYGLQFHPEVDDTPGGGRILRNFAITICGCRRTWSMAAMKDSIIADLKRRVGTKEVFLLVSGGVDSTVAAYLLAKAIGPERLKLLHIDNGFMRLRESEKVAASLRELGLEPQLTFVDASADFLKATERLVLPEPKRAAVGRTFLDVFERETARLGLSGCLLGQGTIYPDTIETGGTKRSDTIKTHHNRVPLIAKMIREGKVVEPLVDLYKEEVRDLGRALGLPDSILGRHPFPGPGLSVRLLCSDQTRMPDLREMQDQATALAREKDLEAVVLPIRSVGVKADLRCYEHPVLLSGMASYETLDSLAASLLREIEGLNRCIWNLGPPPTASPSLLSATMTEERLATLREADAIVTDELVKSGLYDRIWQCPTVLAPCTVGNQGELCIIRPVISRRAMTARPYPLPEEIRNHLYERLSALPGIGTVAIDLTPKPPGTIEWE